MKGKPRLDATLLTTERERSGRYSVRQPVESSGASAAVRARPVKIRDSGFRTITRQKQLAEPSDLTDPIWRAAVEQTIPSFDLLWKNRGVLVVAETHSSILLRGIQALVAEGQLSPDKVSLNWFKRSAQDGTTEVVQGHFDHAGAFGDWPEDFDEVSLKAEARYLDAAESVLQG